VTLSVIQLLAALATLVLIVPGADGVPARSPLAPGRRVPTALAVSASLAGALLLASVCAVSILNWARVDPLGDAAELTGWSLVCWTCYAVTLAWPVLLVAATVGDALHRRRPR
jgi:hypothetical protein